MIQWAALGLAATLLAGCEAPGTDTAPQLKLNVQAVPIRASQLDGVRLLGAHVLQSAHPDFGGFSGLSVRDGRIIAVTDNGWWLEAGIRDTADGIRPVGASFAPLRDSAGGKFDKKGGDAESLTWRDARLIVGFERDHRVMAMDGAGTVTRAIRSRGFERMSSNKGLEALATLPDGTILALAEAHRRGAFSVFRISPGGKVRRTTMPAASRHFATGADIGPDGKLYLLLRDYATLRGVSARIERMEIGANGLPNPKTRRVLASFSTSTGIDNMEGISVWQDDAGRTRITLISDDNFSALQRTLMVDLVLE